jgi:hypothetical protein
MNARRRAPWLVVLASTFCLSACEPEAGHAQGAAPAAQPPAIHSVELRQVGVDYCGDRSVIVGPESRVVTTTDTPGGLQTVTRDLKVYEVARLNRFVIESGLFGEHGAFVLAEGVHMGNAELTVTFEDGTVTKLSHRQTVAMEEPLAFWAIVRILQAQGGLPAE